MGWVRVVPSSDRPRPYESTLDVWISRKRSGSKVRISVSPSPTIFNLLNISLQNPLFFFVFSLRVRSNFM